MFISRKYKELASRLGTGAENPAWLSMMYQKQKGLAMKSKNLSKIYIIDINIVS